MKKLILALALCFPMQAQLPTQQPQGVYLAFKGGTLPQAEQQKFMGTANGWYPWSAPDKLAHFELGVGGGMIAYSVFHDYLKLKHPYLWTLLTGLVVGMGKELYDRRHGGTPEYADAANTAAGFAAGGFTLKIVL